MKVHMYGSKLFFMLKIMYFSIKLNNSVCLFSIHDVYMLESVLVKMCS